jgi:hypothetical protein
MSKKPDANINGWKSQPAEALLGSQPGRKQQKIPGAFAIPQDGGLLHVLFFWGGVILLGWNEDNEVTGFMSLFEIELLICHTAHVYIVYILKSALGIYFH